jgi:hypothetical protein
MTDYTLALSDGVGASIATPTSSETPGILIELQGNAEGRAMRRRVTIRKDDTLPLLVFFVTDGDGGVYDLSGATVTLRLREREADAGEYTVEAECTYVVSGLVTYQLQAADTATPGEYFGELAMDFGSGLIYTTEIFVVQIRERV